MPRTVFLPGAGGRRDFWQPVAEKIGSPADAVLLAWPGFGDESLVDGVSSLHDLVPFVLERAPPVFDLVAQSMGGVVALLIALDHSERLRRLVLTGTSGGIDLSGFETEDWRPDYLREQPESTPRWFVDDRTDVSDRLPSVCAPTLLLWGEDDRVVPPAVGRMLAERIPDARQEVIAGAGHALPQEMPGEVARAIRAFFEAP